MTPSTVQNTTASLLDLREGRDTAGDVLHEALYTVLRPRAFRQRKRWREGGPTLPTTVPAPEA